MRQIISCFTAGFIACSPLLCTAEESSPVGTAENNPVSTAKESGPTAPAEVNNFQPFTGKITRNKVRLRLQPSLEAPILRELSHEDMVIVIGEANEFYAVKPPVDVRGYVFRTYVLDNRVEGKRVNVRLEPDTEAPIIAQLNSGDYVDGVISPLNSKWLEIPPPASAKFYICKEYVDNIGDPSVMVTKNRRREEASTLVETSYEQSQIELQKPYEEMRMNNVFDNLQKVVNTYTDCPDQAADAKEKFAVIQESFIQKKLDYLESKAALAEQQTQRQPQIVEALPVAETTIQPSNNNMKDTWFASENAIYQTWANKRRGGSLEAFYADQEKNGLILTGTVESYDRLVSNKPGDYLLISKQTRIPTAYLYSTKVDLEDYIGKEATFLAVPRPNNNFAFPAYFILSIK
jgi:hypothetical protein